MNRISISPNHRLHEAYTLLELLIVIAIMATLTMIAVPSYREYDRQAKIAVAKGDMAMIEQAIERWVIANGGATFPDSLADVGMANLRDPWGNPYQYLNIANADSKSVGKVRKDKNQHPLNSDYDLYSKGPDGKSSTPLTAAISQDDIIRANNGQFHGLGSEY